jgi:enoyl-[acyl-carrier-protein] reductase (NADH)
MKYVDAEEIADMICCLCSDYGRHVTGQIIGVDGGTQTLYPRS